MSRPVDIAGLDQGGILLANGGAGGTGRLDEDDIAVSLPGYMRPAWADFLATRGYHPGAGAAFIKDL